MTAAAGTPTTRLSSEELGYLLQLAPGDHELAAERLRLPADDAAGRAALAARGGVRIEHGTIRPTLENAAAALVLAAATSWVEIGVAGAGRADVLHVVAGAGAVLVVNRRALGVWEFTGLRPGVPIGAGVLRMLAALLDAPSSGLVVVNRVDRGGGAGPAAVIGVRAGEHWRLARRDDVLPAGAVAALSRSTEPGPGWTAMGAGGPADLLSWVALVVGAGEPNRAPR